VAAFHLGAEGQLAIFQGSKGEIPLAIFNYPTHQEKLFSKKQHQLMYIVLTISEQQQELQRLLAIIKLR